MLKYFYLHFSPRSEKTKLGSTLSGALVSTLVGLAASSLGVVAADAPAYKVVLEYLLPLAIPLLLFNADLRRVMRSTGTLLLAFLVGSGTLSRSISYIYFHVFGAVTLFFFFFSEIGKVKTTFVCYFQICAAFYTL
jgi:uncharacterized membrane protein